MNYFTIISLFFATIAITSPLPEQELEAYNPCPPGLYSYPLCCSTDILGLLCTDCTSLSTRIEIQTNITQIRN